MRLPMRPSAAARARWAAAVVSGVAFSGLVAVMATNPVAGAAAITASHTSSSNATSTNSTQSTSSVSATPSSSSSSSAVTSSHAS